MTSTRKMVFLYDYFCNTVKNKIKKICNCKVKKLVKKLEILNTQL